MNESEKQFSFTRAASVQADAPKPNSCQFLGRADIILASVQAEANQAAFKAKGWTDAESAGFKTVRGTFPASTQTQQTNKSSAKDATTLKDTDAADLYERLLTIQNAADLEWPATNPTHAGVRDEFCLNTFPPDNHAPPPTPPMK